MIERKPVVINYRPGHIYWVLFFMASLVVALLLLGKLWGTFVSDWELAEKAELEIRAEALEAKLFDQTDELSRIKLSAEVDTAALEKSRKEMIGLQRQIYQRDQELKLYRELLQDNDQPNGLSVSDVNLIAMDDGRIRYRWVARQKTAKMQTLGVYADVWIIGIQNEKEVSLPLNEFDEEISRLPVKLEFKYFSINQGILRLPEDFEPDKVRVSLRYSWMDKAQSDQKFDWKIEE
jgi:hypothetical protein